MYVGVGGLKAAFGRKRVRLFWKVWGRNFSRVRTKLDTFKEHVQGMGLNWLLEIVQWNSTPGERGPFVLWTHSWDKPHASWANRCGEYEAPCHMLRHSEPLPPNEEPYQPHHRRDGPLKMIASLPSSFTVPIRDALHGLAAPRFSTTHSPPHRYP